MNIVGNIILHYKILAILGKGGMGVVYKAEDLKLGRIVALKFLSNYPTTSQEDLDRFEREARAIATLNHPNICTIYEFHQTEDYAFIVMEYIEGKTLKRIIEQEVSVPIERTIEIMTAVADALVAVHQKGVIHRDIKPDNIMITTEGQVKIMDFGLAKLKDMPKITKTSSALGTVAYMSPEQLQGLEVDQRADLWSLGVVLYEMMSGELPFQGDSEVSTMHAILNEKPRPFRHRDFRMSGSIQFLLTTLLEKNPALRYQTAEALLLDLQHKVHALKTRLLVRGARKHWKQIAITVIIFILVVCSVNWYYQKYINKPPWMNPNAKLSRLTSELGMEMGRVSPDGNYLAYKNNEGNLFMKDLRKGKIRKINRSDYGTFQCPVWSPDGTQIAYIGLELNSVCIVDFAGNEPKIIAQKKSGNIYHISWSPDGKWIAYIYAASLESEIISKLFITNINGTESRVLIDTKGNSDSALSFLVQTSWLPDGKGIAFYEYNYQLKKSVIRIIKIDDGLISLPIIEPKYLVSVGFPQRGGLVYSPDGKYLVYPDSVNGSIELVAHPMKNNGTRAVGSPIPITKLAGNGAPFWPCFDREGKVLSYGVLRENSDIVIASLDVKNEMIGNKIIPVEINNEEITISACWSHDQEELAYVSDKNGQMDIYIWHRTDNQLQRVTFSKETEEEISFTTDGAAISYIADESLWEVSISSETIKKLYPFNQSDNKSKIYYYCWGADTNTIYALISSPNKEENFYQLTKIDLSRKEIEILVDEISTTISFPLTTDITYAIPTNSLALRYDVRDSSDLEIIQLFNLTTKKQSTIARLSSESHLSDLSFTPDGQSLIYGTWSQPTNYSIYLAPLARKNPKELSSRPAMLAQYPGKISPKGNEIILYNFSDEADIWMLGRN